MDYTVTTRKKLPRNKYGDIYSSSSIATIASGGGSSSSGSSGGGTQYSNFTAATTEAAGHAGLVPAPQAGSNLTNTYLLNSLGTFTNYELLGHLTFEGNTIKPTVSQAYNLGSSSYLINTAYITRWQPTDNSSYYIEFDSTYGAFKVNGSIYATGNVAAGGYSGTSGGSGSGGSDIDVYTPSSLSSSFTSSSTTNTFNAYTIAYLHRRIGVLEGGNINVDMSSYVKKSELSSLGYVTSTSLGNTLSSYVTKTMLSNQSYVTSTALSNQSYLTQATLSNQGYVTNTALGTTLSSYVTKSMLSNQSYLVKTGDTMSGNLTMGSGTKIIFNSSPASYIQYDSSNGALMVYGSIYATGNVAAGGYSGTSGSGSGSSSGGGSGAAYNLVVSSTATGTTNASSATNDPYLNLIYSSDGSNWSVSKSVRLYSTNGNNIQWNNSNNRIDFKYPSSVSVNNGSAETGKYISAISASGSTITVTKEDLPTGSSTAEWYNIKTEKVKDPSTQKWTLHTIIENFGGSPLETECTLGTGSTPKYVSGQKYRLVLMTFRRHQNTSRAWRVPMFSRIWDLANKSHPEYQYDTQERTVSNAQDIRQDYLWKKTWWTITTNNTVWFWNRYFNTAVSGAPKLLKTENSTNFVVNDYTTGTDAGIDLVNHRWKGNKNKKKRIGCAIFKYTGTGTFGWQRVSNIAYVDLFITKNNIVHTNVVI